MKDKNASNVGWVIVGISFIILALTIWSLVFVLHLVFLKGRPHTHMTIATATFRSLSL